MPPGEQTTTSVQKPPGYQSRIYRTAANDAMKMYRQGIGTNPGSMVVPYSKQSTGAFEDLMRTSRKNSDGRGLSGELQNIINGGGFNDQQQDALGNWQDTANSTYDFNANPGSQGVLDSILRDTKDAANLNAAAGGRYGSGLHQGRLSQDVGDVSSQFRMNDFNSWLGRKDSANSNLFNGAQAGLGNMQSAYQGLQAPAQTALGVGTAQEDLKRRTLDDRARVANEPWTHLQRLLAAGGGMGSYGTTTSTAPGQNPWLTAIGIGGTVGNLAFGTNPMASGGLLGAFS